MSPTRAPRAVIVALLASCAQSPRAALAQTQSPVRQGIWTGVAGYPREMFVGPGGAIEPVAGREALRLRVSGPSARAGENGAIPADAIQTSLSLFEGHLPIVIAQGDGGGSPMRLTIVPDLFADALWAFVRVSVPWPSAAPGLRLVLDSPSTREARVARSDDATTLLVGEDVLLIADRPATGDPPGWLLEPDERDDDRSSMYFAVPVESVRRNEDGVLPRPDAAGFSGRLRRVSDWWRATLHRVELNLPDRELADAWYSGLARILLARDGAALRPAPGQDDRFVLGSAALQCAALDAAGLHEVAADSLRFMLRTQMRTGQFPAELADGQPATPDRRWRSQGQAVFALATHYRLTRDRGWLRAVYPALRRACGFLLRTRQPQLGDALLGRPDYGLLPATGRRVGPDLYADNCWAIYALRTTADLADELDRDEDAESFRRAAKGLVRWLRRSLEQVRQTEDLAADTEAPDAEVESRLLTAARAIWPTGVMEKTDALVHSSFMVYLQEGHEPSPAPDGGPERSGTERETLALRTPSRSVRLSVAHALLMLDRADLAWRALRSERASVADDCGADAEYVLLLRDALIAERDDGLSLFEGVPLSWWAEGATAEVSHAPTPHGPVSIALESRPTQHSVSVRVRNEAGEDLPECVIHAPRGFGIGRVKVRRPRRTRATVQEGRVEVSPGAQRLDLSIQPAQR